MSVTSPWLLSRQNSLANLKQTVVHTYLLDCILHQPKMAFWLVYQLLSWHRCFLIVSLYHTYSNGSIIKRQLPITVDMLYSCTREDSHWQTFNASISASFCLVWIHPFFHSLMTAIICCIPSLEPRLSVPDFVSQLWRKIGGKAWKDFSRDTVAPWCQSTNSESNTSHGMFLLCNAEGLRKRRCESQNEVQGNRVT